MVKKEFAHLLKPLHNKQPPQGLYPQPRFWMEGRDLEGFNAHFSFGFINTPCTLHPVEGSLIHPFDECLVFEGTDSSNILHLGAEISIELGEEREQHVFNEPSVVLIPRGLPHGPVRVRSVDNTIVHYSIGLAADYQAETVNTAESVSDDGKYSHLIKKMVTTPKTGPNATGSGMGYETVIGKDGVMRPAEFGIGPGNGDEVVWLYGSDLEGFEINFTWGFYSRCGKWHRGGEAHTHPEEEILCFVGLDENNPEDLGAEQELGMGPDHERHIFNKSTVAICPAGFAHLPLVTRWVDKPYGFFVICLSGEHASPWVEA